MSPQIGLLLALGCAFATNLAFLWKHKGAVAAPEMSFKHPLASAAGLFRSKWFTIGFLVAIAAWVLHVFALALAPISLVQAVISGGLVFLAVLADRWFGFELGRREWMGVGLTALGLAFLGLTVQSAGSEGTHSSYSISGMIAFEGGMILIGTLLLLSHRVERISHRHGVLLGAAAGILFGVSDISIKALTGTVPGDLLSIISPWTGVAILASIAAFYASARSLQVGEGVSTIAITAVAANASAIIGGILVFGEPIGSGPLQIAGRFIAFCLVIAGAALMPTHAEQLEPDENAAPR
jgi:drug/metabolite transporter (DMT)-like permease